VNKEQVATNVEVSEERARITGTLNGVKQTVTRNDFVFTSTTIADSIALSLCVQNHRKPIFPQFYAQ